MDSDDEYVFEGNQMASNKFRSPPLREVKDYDPTLRTMALSMKKHIDFGMKMVKQKNGGGIGYDTNRLMLADIDQKPPVSPPPVPLGHRMIVTKDLNQSYNAQIHPHTNLNYGDKKRKNLQNNSKPRSLTPSYMASIGKSPIRQYYQVNTPGKKTPNTRSISQIRSIISKSTELLKESKNSPKKQQLPTFSNNSFNLSPFQKIETQQTLISGMKGQLSKQKQMSRKIEKNIQSYQIEQHLNQKKLERIQEKRRLKQMQRKPRDKISMKNKQCFRAQNSSYLVLEKVGSKMELEDDDDQSSQSSLKSREEDFEKLMKGWHINEMKMATYKEQYQDYKRNHYTFGMRSKIGLPPGGGYLG